MTEIKLTTPAAKQIKRLDREVRIRIYSKLNEAKGWPAHFLKPLTGYNYYSLRAGDYRAIIQWKKDRDQIWVISVGHRKNVYDNL